MPKNPLHLSTMTADILTPDEPYVFMDTDALQAELRAIQGALPHRAARRGKGPSRADGMALGRLLEEVLPHGWPPTADALASALAPLPRSQSELLDRRLDQVDRGLRALPFLRGRDYDPPRVLAVSRRWDRRWLDLLSGALRPAWVGFVPIDPTS